MLSLDALEQTAFDAVPSDEVVQRRPQEIEFAKSSLDLAHLVNAGDVVAARALVSDLERRFGQHPWLKAKLGRLRELSDRDPDLMSKEVRFNSRKMSRRLVAREERNLDEAFCITKIAIRSDQRRKKPCHGTKKNTLNE